MVQYPEAVKAAEAAVIGRLLLDPDEALDTGLLGEDFYDIRYKAIWEAGRGLFEAKKPVDPISVMDALALSGTLAAVGNISFLTGLALGAPGAGVAGHHADIIKNAASIRKLRVLGAQIEGDIASGSELADVVDRARAYLDTMERSNTDHCIALDEEIKAEVGRIGEDLALIKSGKAPNCGLPTGLGLERVVPGGIPRDRMTMVFGETGTLKTAIKQWMCDTMAMAGHYVLDFSIEDSTQLTAQRFMSRYSGIPYNKIAARELTDDEFRRIEEIAPEAAKAAKRVIVVGNVPATIDEAIRLSRYWAKRVPLAAVFLDYIQIMDLDSSNTFAEHQQLYRVCKLAQRAAHRDKIAWVLVSQCNKGSENRLDKRPQLFDMYGSSAMRQTCKLAIGVYRPEKHEKVPGEESPWSELYNLHPKGKQLYKGAMELWVRKNFGETDVFVPAVFDLGTGSVVEVKL